MTQIVCLHGFTGQPQSWQPVLDALSDLAGEVEALCPALLGHGLEPPQAAGDSFEAEVDRLAVRLVAEGKAGCHLLGYSMGGRVGLGLLVRHPQLFLSATLIGVHGGLQSTAARQERRLLDELRAEELEQQGLEAFLETWQELPLFASQKSLPEATLATQHQHRLAHQASGLATALRRLSPAEMPDYHGSLQQLEVPVTFVAGALDAKYLPIARSLAESMPRGSLQAVPGVGHNVVLEAPQQVATVVAETIASVDSRDNRRGEAVESCKDDPMTRVS